MQPKKGTRLFFFYCGTILFLLTSITFFPSLENGFTNFGDQEFLTENTHVQNFSIQSMVIIFSSAKNIYHPLTSIVASIEYLFFGLNPKPYHLVNLLLHSINTILVFAFLFCLGGNHFAAFLGALLFGVHPTHVEPVAWVSGQKDVLSGFFFLGGLLSYLNYSKSRMISTYAWAFVFFFLSFLSKPLGFSLPFLLLLIDCYLEREICWGLIKEKIPFFLLIFLFGGLIFFRVIGQVNLNPDVQFGSLLHFLSVPFLISFFVVKTIIPADLSPIYSAPTLLDLQLPSYLYFYLFFPPILFTMLAYFWKIFRKIAFSAFFFLIFLIPVFTFIPFGRFFAANHSIYLPSVGLFFLFGEGINGFFRTSLGKTKIGKFFAVALMVGLFGVLVFQSHQRNRIWTDSLSLWNEVLFQDPNNIEALYRRGLYYQSKNDFRRAFEDFQKGLTLKPDYWLFGLSLANLSSEMGDVQSAFSYLNKALESPSKVSFHGKIYAERGLLLVRIGEFGKAALDFEKSIKIDPNVPEVFYYRGFAFKSLGKVREALEDFSHAIYLSPYFMEAFKLKGLTLMENKELVLASHNLQKALSLAPWDPQNWLNSGNLCRVNEDFNGAIQCFSKAIEISPDFVEALRIRGVCYQICGAFSLATKDFEKAAKGDPKNFINWYSLGIAKIEVDQIFSGFFDLWKAFVLAPRSTLERLITVFEKYLSIQLLPALKK